MDAHVLWDTIEGLINQGVNTFYVGNQGGFDGVVYRCLKQLQKMYPHIRISVVLAYLPTKKQEGEDMSDTIYPEIEGHPKFAIERRNRWRIAQSDYCVCCINRGLTVINLGNATMEGDA